MLYNDLGIDLLAGEEEAAKVTDEQLRGIEEALVRLLVVGGVERLGRFEAVLETEEISKSELERVTQWQSR